MSQMLDHFLPPISLRHVPVTRAGRVVRLGEQLRDAEMVRFGRLVMHPTPARIVRRQCFGRFEKVRTRDAPEHELLRPLGRDVREPLFESLPGAEQVVWGFQERCLVEQREVGYFLSTVRRRVLLVGRSIVRVDVDLFDEGFRTKRALVEQLDVALVDVSEKGFGSDVGVAVPNSRPPLVVFVFGGQLVPADLARDGQDSSFVLATRQNVVPEKRPRLESFSAF